MAKRQPTITMYKKTSEDWYPSFLVGNSLLVRVNLHDLLDHGWRVSVWGDDDRGMEKNFQSMDDAKKCFQSICLWYFVDEKALLDSGFMYV